MQAAIEGSRWDFTPVIDLIYSLSPRQEQTATRANLLHPEGDDVTSDKAYKLEEDEIGSEDSNQKLGNFDKLWQYLGQPLDAPPPHLGSLSTQAHELTGEDAENATGLTENVQLNKGVRCRDEVDGADLEDNADSEPPLRVTRNQKRLARKSAARKRKEEIAKQRANGPKARSIASDTTTDDESDGESRHLQRSPDRRAIHHILHGSPDHDASGSNENENSSPPTSTSPPKESKVQSFQQRWPTSHPFYWQAVRTYRPATEAIDWQTRTQWHTSQPQVEPLVMLSPAERKAKLTLMLIENFPEEQKYLFNAGLPDPAFTSINIVDIGIHVFVDISNIMIGFHDCVKAARDIPTTAHIRRLPFSFHNFSLVLERGRPAAKRVLVGSDKFQAIQDAKQIGYETNILERVHKAKEITPRHKKIPIGNGQSGPSTSGSETNAASYAPEKWVEQAVDEILHLKILESLVDNMDKPSTIVLTTGDAAEAEYSGGFMKMVERALEKGWMVELVSFRLNTSSSYKRKEFRAKWGPMFKMVQLDEYVEELLDL